MIWQLNISPISIPFEYETVFVVNCLFNWLSNSSGTCAARRCVWFTIKSVGGVSDPDPTPPNPPEQSSCDMTKIFGGLNGDHTLKLTSHGKK